VVLVAAVTFVVVVATELVLALVMVLETVPRRAAGSHSRTAFTIEGGKFCAGDDSAPRRLHGSFRPQNPRYRGSPGALQPEYTNSGIKNNFKCSLKCSFDQNRDLLTVEVAKLRPPKRGAKTHCPQFTLSEALKDLIGYDLLGGRALKRIFC
jgi:hypothetical protein